VEEAADTGAAGRVEQALGTTDVDRPELIAGAVLLGERRGMHDHVDILEVLGDDIGQRAAQRLGSPLPDSFGRALRARHGDDVVLLRERFRHRAADETRGPGHENAHRAGTCTADRRCPIRAATGPRPTEVMRRLTRGARSW